MPNGKISTLKECFNTKLTTLEEQVNIKIELISLNSLGFVVECDDLTTLLA